MLAALRLAADHNACRDMGNAHGSFYLVDILSAFTTGAEGVCLQVLRTDIDLDTVVDFRDNKHGSEGGVPPRGLIEGRNPHQPVHAGFSGKQAIGILPGKLNRGGLDARLFSGALLKNGGSDALTL